MSDFVSVINDLSSFVQNERTSSYNEGVDSVLLHAKTWMMARNIMPQDGEDVGVWDLLNQIADHYKGGM